MACGGGLGEDLKIDHFTITSGTTNTKTYSTPIKKIWAQDKSSSNAYDVWVDTTWSTTKFHYKQIKGGTAGGDLDIGSTNARITSLSNDLKTVGVAAYSSWGDCEFWVWYT